jgi:hypothetical protein
MYRKSEHIGHSLFTSLWGAKAIEEYAFEKDWIDTAVFGKNSSCKIYHWTSLRMIPENRFTVKRKRPAVERAVPTSIEL